MDDVLFQAGLEIWLGLGGNKADDNKEYSKYRECQDVRCT